MSKPRPVRWEQWPQSLAPNTVVNLNPGKRTGERGLPGYHFSLLRCATMLSERSHVAIEDIVVFYPMKLRPNVSRNIRRTRAGKGLAEFQGLSICATRDLSRIAVAFRIEDVEAHRTPADAFHVNIRSRTGKRGIEPAPLYTKEESNLGREIRE